MKKATIKQEHLDTQIGFNGSGVPLRFRTQEDINALARLALGGQDAYLLSLFDTLPTEEELRENAGASFLESNPAPAEPAPAPAEPAPAEPVEEQPAGKGKGK